MFLIPAARGEFLSPFSLGTPAPWSMNVKLSDRASELFIVVCVSVNGHLSPVVLQCGLAMN